MSWLAGRNGGGPLSVRLATATSPQPDRVNGLFAQIFEEFLDPGEEAFAFRVGAMALALLIEFAQQFLLALVQIDRGLDGRLDEHVAARGRAQHRHALSI